MRNFVSTYSVLIQAITAKRNQEETQQQLTEANKNLRAEIELRKDIQLRLYNSEEKERRRIASELHDGLGQKLTAAKLALGAIQNSKVLEGDLSTVLSESINIIEESMREVREISHNITPSVLSDYGLSAALSKICDRLGDYQKSEVEFNLSGEEFVLGTEVQTTLYRVGQEAINNASKYAQASKIIVNLSFDGDEVSLTVIDDGVGFDPQAVAKRGGTGIGNMKERCRLIKAYFELMTQPGQGTKVKVKYSKARNG